MTSHQIARILSHSSLVVCSFFFHSDFIPLRHFKFRNLFYHWYLFNGDLLKRTTLLYKWINSIITIQNTNVLYTLAPIQWLVMDELKTFNVGKTEKIRMNEKETYDRWMKSSDRSNLNDIIIYLTIYDY